MKDEKFNPLEGWTKEQIKSALKAHSKSDLLKLCVQWRFIAESYAEQLKEITDKKDES
jgi:hypothetical protein